MLPLTPNAKIDRKALSLRPLASAALITVGAAEASDTDNMDGMDGMAAAALESKIDEMQQRVAGLWQRLLPASGTEPGQDFYLAGGDSLIAARLAGAIRKEFGIRISLGELIRLRTIQDQAAYLQTRLQAEASS
jgi:acyl carrier protein